jgi:hypothetical protein
MPKTAECQSLKDLERLEFAGERIHGIENDGQSQSFIKIKRSSPANDWQRPRQMPEMNRVHSLNQVGQLQLVEEVTHDLEEVGESVRKWHSPAVQSIARGSVGVSLRPTGLPRGLSIIPRARCSSRVG